jgi:hypothetical protein
VSRITFIRNLKRGPEGYEISDKSSDVIAILDSSSLHSYMLRQTGKELQFLVEPCYYPRVASIFKELMHRTRAKEKELVKYSKIKYFNPKWKLKNPKLLQDPQTILLVLIAQDFVRRNDYAGAIAAFNLLALRYYTNTMFKFIKHCNENYFRSALENLSHNHLFNTRKTIGTAILYLSKEVFERYKNDMANDNAEEIVNMIYYLRTRINQSVRSFANHYYKIAEGGGATRQQIEDMPEKENIDKKLKQESSKLAKNITVYASIDKRALQAAQQITRFNRNLSVQYTEALVNTKYTEKLELALYLLMRSLTALKATESQYIDISKKLMSVKVSKKPVFYKKTLIEIHDQIILDLGISQKFEKFSAQSKHIARSFLSYYLTLMVFNHFNN